MPSSPLMSDVGERLSRDAGKVLSKLELDFGCLVEFAAISDRSHPYLRRIAKDSSMANPLDRTDLKMLRLLQNNGRLSNAELADAVGVSPATCHRRTQRLF